MKLFRCCSGTPESAEAAADIQLLRGERREEGGAQRDGTDQ